MTKKMETNNQKEGDLDVFVKILNSPEAKARREAAWEEECRMNEIQYKINNAYWAAVGSVVTVVALIVLDIL